MGTWTINPSSAATIDSTSGIITFKNNTSNSDRVITVSYEDEYGNSASTTVTQMGYSAIDQSGIDLGLPSGNIWANININNNEFFQYGSGAFTFPYTSGGTPYQGYENPLYAIFDTASRGWGGPWHIPTSQDFQELFNYANYRQVHTGNNYFAQFTSRINGATVVFPCNGYIVPNGSPTETTKGFYWTSSMDDRDEPYVIEFKDNEPVIHSGSDFGDEIGIGNVRALGANVRGVYKDYSRVKY